MQLRSQLSAADTVAAVLVSGASFGQTYNSNGANTCWVRTFGYTGSLSADFGYNDSAPNPNYSQFGYGQTLLWDSGPSHPTSYNFATVTLGDPVTAAPPLGPYTGYKWWLQCTNAYESKTKVMYGTSMP